MREKKQEMFSRNVSSRWLCLFFTAVVLAAGALLPSGAQTLQGHLTDENLRLTPSAGRNSPSSRGGQSLRISRAPAALSGSVVDASAFASPASGKTGSDSLTGSLVQSADFARPPRNFDIGAERGSREMVLAWERWHKQLSEAIYTRWQRVARDPGKATIKVTVSANRQITAEMLDSSGKPAFNACIMDVIESLDGNPGLAFPSKSQRRQVSFEADYIASPDIRPGYTWVKNDYERVREGY